MKLTKTLLASALVAIVVSVAASFVFNSPPSSTVVKTVDLGKIINAQMILGSRALNSELAAEPWMASITDGGKDLADIIEEIAGKDALVIVGPAVIQGAEDITKAVLVRMGLPSNVPDYNISQKNILPSAKDILFDGEDVQLGLQAEDNEDEWLMP